MVKLTKADILKGVNNVKTQYFEKLGGELDLRPLTEGEWAEIEMLKSGGAKILGSPEFTTNGGVDINKMKDNLKLEIDSREMQRLAFEAEVKAVAYGLSVGDEVWTVEEVKGLRPIGVVEDIAKVIYDISGVSEETSQLAKSFRKESRGADDTTNALSGDTV